MTRSTEIQKAREIDTQIAAEWDKYWTVANQLETKLKGIEEAKKTISWTRHAAALASLEARIERYTAEAAVLRDEANLLRAAAIKMDQDLYEGWNRFFLVKHIHNSQHCSSFRATTRVGWLPSVSGLTEAEAVKEHGATLCTICFPSAPVELTTKTVDPDQCTGSGKHYDTEHLTGREGAYYSPAGYCPDCGRWNTITKTMVMRKHKVDPTKRHW